jgi:hypothetical protein
MATATREAKRLAVKTMASELGKKAIGFAVEGAVEIGELGEELEFTRQHLSRFL